MKDGLGPKKSESFRGLLRIGQLLDHKIINVVFAREVFDNLFLSTEWVVYAIVFWVGIECLMNLSKEIPLAEKDSSSRVQEPQTSEIR